MFFKVVDFMRIQHVYVTRITKRAENWSYVVLAVVTIILIM